MTPHTGFTAEAPRSSSSLRRIALLAVLLCAVSLLALQFITHSRSRAQQFSLADRIAAQRAIEQVYWEHRLWPKENPQPKPTLDEMLPATALQAKVEEYLRQSVALAQVWQRPVTAAELQAEMERMARDTKQPAVLGELWAALGNDPLLIAECLARPTLVERRVREQYEAEGAAVQAAGAAEQQRASFEEWWLQAREGLPMNAAAAGSDYRLPQIAVEADACFAEKWTATSATGVPDSRNKHTAIWTGSEMIVWGGERNFSRRDTGGKYNPATDTWTPTNTTGAPSPRYSHTAIWTGSEMIIWGGSDNLFPFITNTGGRYNPTTDTWIATSTTNAPSVRSGQTAIWSGSEMIIWGGEGLPCGGACTLLNSGGRYNPSTDTWVTTSLANVPTARLGHTAVWAGSVMLVWGGYNGNTHLSTGGQYNPITNAWTAISTASAPSARSGHTGVWTGTEMIIWGGYASPVYPNTGGRYNPATNIWMATSTTNTPGPRSDHTAVWTGSEMIVWGGSNLDSGRRYNPSNDSWIATSDTNVPSARSGHCAVWTGSTMLVWGGQGSNGFFFNTGSVYNPSAYALTVSPTTKTMLGDGGNETITVTSPTGCAWTATSNTNWLTITSGASGTGNGAVGYTVAANDTGTPRTATLNVGNTTFAVTQGIINPVPTLTSISPSAAVAGSAAFTLTVTGTNFVNGSVVRWGGSDRTTTFVSATQLTAAIPATDIALAGTPNVTVFNPPSGGGVSNALPFTITGTIDLALGKRHFGDFTDGVEGSYELRVENIGTAPTTGVITVTDTLPNGLSFASFSGDSPWSCAAAGQTVTCTRSTALAAKNTTYIYLRVNVGPAAVPSVTNTATVATDGDANATNNMASDPTKVNCGYRLRPTKGQYFDAAGGSGTIQIETLSICAWTATTTDNWITINGANTGTGNGSVNFTVAANTDAAARRGVVSISGTNFTVIQSGTSVVCRVTPLAASGQVVNGSLDATDCTSLNQGGSYADRYSFSGVAGQQIDLRAEALGFFPKLALFDQNGVLIAAHDSATTSQRIARLTRTLEASGTYSIEVAGSFAQNAYTLSLNSVLPGCSFAVTPATQSFELSGGNGMFAVTSTSGCEWRASTLARWITLAANSSGSSDGTVNFTVAPNTGGKRTGTIFVGGQSVTITQAGAPDSSFRGKWQGTTSQNRPIRFTVDDNLQVVDLQVDIYYQVLFVPPFTQVACTYFMTPVEPVQVKDGQFTVKLQNAALGIVAGKEPVLRVAFDSTRTAEGGVSDFTGGLVFCGSYVSFGERTISGATFTVQKQLVCPTVTSFNPANALTGQSVKITGTNLTSVTGVKFGGNVAAQFSVNSGGTELTAIVPMGAASGAITLSAADCADVQTAAFTVTGNCAYTLSATAQNFNANAGTGSVGITTDGNCNWTATSNANWIALTGNTSGSGNGTVNFSVATNTGAARTGTITVAGQTLIVTQEAPNPVPTLASLDPASVVAGGAGFTLTLNGTGFVTASVVQVNGNNRATTLVNGTRLTIALTAADVAAAGTLTLAVVNPAPGGGTSGTQTFTINPACAYTLAPTTQAFSAAGGSGTVAITTGSGCVWTAVAEADWITILTSKSGVGNDTLRYEVAPLSTGTRTGRITISGQAFTITQTVPPPLSVASVNAASYTPNAPLAPDSIVSAFGENLANSDTGQAAPSLPLPTMLNGTTLQVKDSLGITRLAGLFYVGKTQVNYLLPTDTAAGTATVTVTTGAGIVSVGTVQIALVAPGVFAANADGKGPVVGAAVRVKNGVVIGQEPLVRYDPVLQKMVSVPLDVSAEDERVVIQIYGTGIRHRSSLTNVTATIGGVNAEVEYAGIAPGYVGLDQVNIVMPRSLSGRGEVELVLLVEGKGANTVRINIK